MLAYIAGLGLWPPEVEFWGVNTMCCVLGTATGTADWFSEAGYPDVPIAVNLRYCGDRSTLRAVRFKREA